MNLFFGFYSNNTNDSFSSMAKNIESLHCCRSNVLCKKSNGNSSGCGYISDDGAIVGTGFRNGVHIVLLGLLQRPLPGWKNGSPIDDPDRTAGYLISRYLTHGTKFLDGVNGYFSLALHDQNSGQLFLACDPKGFRRLFYYWDNENIAFSTNLASLATGYKPAAKLDRSYEDFLLGFEFIPWNKTIFKKVNCISKSSMLVFSQNGLKSVPLTPHSIKSKNVESVNERIVINRLYEKFLESLHCLCPTEKKVAVLLGGFDSALVASALQRIGKKVETFTFRFQNEKYNQNNVDTLKRTLNHNHSWIEITPDVIRNGLEKYPNIFNQPASQMHYLIQTAYACSIIRSKGYSHCFTGDGCDEMFLGYPNIHFRANLFHKMRIVPSLYFSCIYNVLRSQTFEKIFGHPVRLLRNIIKNLGRKMPMRGHITHRVFDDFSLDILCNSIRPSQEREVEDILFELAQGLDGFSVLRLAYHGKSSVGLNNVRNEGSSSVSGITLQSPYQHAEFLNLTANLPEKMLRPDGNTKGKSIGKYILLKMAEEKKLLPGTIIYQKKASPVTSPVDDWYMSTLKNDILKSVENLQFDFNEDYVCNLLEPKFVETLFRRYVGISHCTSQAASLLATYSSYMFNNRAS